MALATYTQRFSSIPAFGEASEAPALGLTPKGGPRAYAGKKWKISKIAATKCHIVRTKCTNFDFCWGPAPDPIWEL